MLRILAFLAVTVFLSCNAQLQFSISDINSRNSEHFSDSKPEDGKLTFKPGKHLINKPKKFETKPVSIKKSVSYDGTAQGGSINQNRKNNTILTFEVKKTDSEGNVFVCLKVKFALTILLQNVTSSFESQDQEQKITLSQSMTNATNAELHLDSCENLLLNWENAGDDPENKEGSNPTILLKFSVEQSEKDGGNVQIYYLQNLQADDLDFIEKSSKNKNGTSNIAHHKAETILGPFTKEGPTKPKYQQDPQDTDDLPQTTPVEASIDQSFKCYFGFENENKNNFRDPVTGKLNDQEMVHFKFDHFQMQINEKFDKENVNAWKPVLSCDYDVSRILPVVVGAVLGGIVVFTIVGYFIAKKRSERHSYQEL